MPRGKYVNHKGRSRQYIFTSPEEQEEERKKQNKNKYRNKKEDDDDESGSDIEEEKGSEESGSEEEEEDDDDSDSDDENKKKKGVSGLIDIENPNRVQKKQVQKVTAVNPNAPSSSGKPELSRREREEIEKQRSQAHYQKLHAEGKTEQARADLARLAIIKQHRAEAAARREQEKKEKEERKTGK